MHPAFLHWWKHGRRHGDCGVFYAHGDHWTGDRGDYFASGARPESSFRSSAGVRRPLRFLAYKLDLSESQVSEMARILNELKTERAQAEVDARRTLATFSDAIEADSFDGAKAAEGATLRVRSAERLRDAVVHALEQIHDVLSPEQRGKLAYLIRTGALAL